MSMQKDSEFWLHDMSVSRASIGEIPQFYFDKASLTLEAKALIAYPVHVVPFNSSPCWRSWLINNEHAEVVFLLVGNVEC